MRSARYAAKGDGDSDDEANNDRLIEELAGVEDRRAYYYCALVLVRGPDDPCPLIAEGRWHGTVTQVGRGSGGFGYDPFFLIPELGLTAAELEPAHKNGISHRGQAMRVLAQLLARELSPDPAAW